MTLTLRDYQETAINHVFADWQSYKRLLVMSATGTGKTVILLAIIYNLLKRNPEERVLLIAHREELIQQPIDRASEMFPDMARKMGVVMANVNEWGKQILVASVQSLNSGNRLETLKQQGIDTIVIDEAHHCHVSGTLVLTTRGDVKIEDVSIGDFVYGWSGEWGEFRVTNKFIYWHDGTIYDIITKDGAVSVTGNHMMYSGGSKKYAREIRVGDSISMPVVRLEHGSPLCSFSTYPLASSGNETLSEMQGSNAIRPVKSACESSRPGFGGVPPLQQGVWQKANRRAHSNDARIYTGAERENAREGDGKQGEEQRIQAGVICQNEKEKPHEQTGGKGKDDRYHSKDGREWGISSLWKQGGIRKRKRTNCGGVGTHSHPKKCKISACRFVTGWGEAIPLQNRLCIRENKNSRGSGREFSFCELSENGRCQKRNAACKIGVGNNKNNKFASLGEWRGLGESEIVSIRKRQYRGYIHDIEVEKAHNYIANGLLSSNSPANSYTAIIDAFPEARVLGLTATPMRTDQIALSHVFEKVSFKFTIQNAIKAGALVPFRPFGFSVPVTMPKDWEPKEGNDPKAGDLLSAENVLEIVFEKWREFAADRQTIGFTSSVRQAHMTAEYFASQGVPSAAIDGTTKNRSVILKQFQSGELQCLFNCQVLTEGFDAPETGCIVMVAPTGSDLVYVQRMGRGLRTAQGKSDCVVLDFAPLGNRNLVMAGDVLDGIPKRAKETHEKAEQAGVMLYGLSINDFGEAGYIDPDDVKATVLDYLNKHKLAWAFDGVIAAATVSDKYMICIVTPERDRIDKADGIRRNGGLTAGQKRVYEWLHQYRLFMVEKVQVSEERHDWTATLRGGFATIQEAKECAEDLAQPLVDNRIAAKNAPWRHKPMSDAQAGFLKRLGGYAPHLTMGQAGQRISFLLASGAVKRQTAQLERAMAKTAVQIE